MALKDYALIDAVVDNNLAEVKKLLKEGANPNILGNYGWTALHEACANPNIKEEIIEALIAARADVNLHAVGGISALHLAVKNSNLNIVKKLVSAGADIEYMNAGKKSVLYYSAFSKNIKIPSYIMSKLSNIASFNSDGDTALHLLLKEDKKEAVYNLVLLGFDVDIKDSKGKTACKLSEELASKIPLYKSNIALLKALNTRKLNQKLNNNKGNRPKFF